MTLFNNVDHTEIEHYGVKGMKWGVRRSRSQRKSARKKRVKRVKKIGKNMKRSFKKTMSDPEKRDLVITTGLAVGIIAGSKYAEHKILQSIGAKPIRRPAAQTLANVAKSTQPYVFDGKVIR